ncbi:MAG: hypothetical protein P1P64_03185 [Treponemataceae bacterium]
MKNLFSFMYVMYFFAICFIQSTVYAETPNPNSIYPAKKLGSMLVHMSKITSPFKGSAPAIELLFSSERFQWRDSQPIEDWGKPGKTKKYFEDFIPGTHIIFNITNKLDDVTYYRTDGVHPYKVPLYETPTEAEFLKRFVFFKFTATAAKNLLSFQRDLNNDLYALDTYTKLIWQYSMPTDYEKMIGNNYIPRKWMPYELAPNTKNAGLKFYEYDPIGFISENWDCSFFKIQTNIHIYDWWQNAIQEGKNMQSVKEKRFMPVVNPNSENDWTIRDINRPVKSPYRKVANP